MERLQEILAALADPTGLTDVEIAEFEAELIDLAAELRTEIDEAGDDATPEQVMAVIEIANAVTAIRELAAERIEAAEAQAVEDAAAAQAVADMLAEAEAIIAGPEDGEAEGGDEGDADAGADDGDGGDAADAEANADEPELVTAGATPPAPAPARARTTPAVPRRYAPRTTEPARRSLNAHRVGGGEFASIGEIGQAILERAEDAEGMGIADGKTRVARIRAEYDDAHTIDHESEGLAIHDEIMAAQRSGDTEAFASLTAAGGVCAPPENRYEFERVAGTQRPLRDSLTAFNAKRGGVAFVPPAQLTSITSTGGTSLQGIGAVTNAQDSSGTQKTYQIISCGTQTTVTVDSVYEQYEIGNATSRFNPERQDEFVSLGHAAYSRFNEQRLWTKMLAAVTGTTNFPQSLGASRDLITGLNRVCINYRGALRMAKDAIVEIRLPAWVGMGLIPDDQTRALQSFVEQFSVDAAWLEARLLERNIRVAGWYEDDFTTALSAGGGVNAYPSVVKVIFNHPGAWAIVDGGTLDLGVFRDTTTVNNNAFRIFYEEFWNVAMWGVQAWTVQFSLCANGASAGSKATTCGS